MLAVTVTVMVIVMSIRSSNRQSRHGQDQHSNQLLHSVGTHNGSIRQSYRNHVVALLNHRQL